MSRNLMIDLKLFKYFIPLTSNLYGIFLWNVNRISRWKYLGLKILWLTMEDQYLGRMCHLYNELQYYHLLGLKDHGQHHLDLSRWKKWREQLSLPGFRHWYTLPTHGVVHRQHRLLHTWAKNICKSYYKFGKFWLSKGTLTRWTG